MAHRAEGLLTSDRKAKVIVRWHGVRELSLAGIDPEQRNWIDGLALTPVDEGVRADMS
jgi:hypothetical protein